MLNAKGVRSDSRRSALFARNFEGWMIGQMLQPMFKSIKTNGMFGGGYGEDSFRELLVDEYGKKRSPDRAGSASPIWSAAKF